EQYVDAQIRLPILRWGRLPGVRRPKLKESIVAIRTPHAKRGAAAPSPAPRPLDTGEGCKPESAPGRRRRHRPLRESFHVFRIGRCAFSLDPRERRKSAMMGRRAA